LSSSERRIRRSCRNWKKHLALTAAACLFIDMSDVSNTPSTRTTLDAAMWSAATRNLQQIVLRPSEIHSQRCTAGNTVQLGFQLGNLQKKIS